MDKFLSLFPPKVESISVNHSSMLAEIGKKLFSVALNNKLLEDTHWVDNYVIRKAYTYSDTSPQCFTDIIKSELLPFLDTDLEIVGIRVEETLPYTNFNSYSNSISRVEGIIPVEGNSISLNRSWSSCHWHCDFKEKLNAINFITYLNDINYNQGGTLFAKPIQQLQESSYNDRGKYKFSPCSSDNIPYIEIIGKEGTVLSFHGHVLHRANLPQSGSRRCLHFLAYSDMREHTASTYL